MRARTDGCDLLVEVNFTPPFDPPGKEFEAVYAKDESFIDPASTDSA